MLKLPSLPLFGLNLLSIFIRCLKDFRRFFMFCVWWDFIEFKKSSNAEKIIDFVIKSEKLRIITWNLRHEAIRVIQCEWWVNLEILMKGRRRRLTVRLAKNSDESFFFFPNIEQANFIDDRKIPMQFLCFNIWLFPQSI